MTYRLSRDARADLDEIWLYIAQDSPSNADNFIDAILDECSTIGKSPGIGVKRYGLHMHPYKRYNIYYEPMGGRVEIARILHSARRQAKVLFGE